jgi:hypothetical protein
VAGGGVVLLLARRRRGVAVRGGTVLPDRRHRVDGLRCLLPDLFPARRG